MQIDKRLGCTGLLCTVFLLMSTFACCCLKPTVESESWIDTLEILEILNQAWSVATIDSIGGDSDTTRGDIWVNLPQDTIGTQRQDVSPKWDCENTAALDSAQAVADSQDAAGYARCKNLDRLEMEKHQGHEVSVSDFQNLVFYPPGSCAATCWQCATCGHFDLYHYVPLERMEIHCGGRVWRIKR